MLQPTISGGSGPRSAEPSAPSRPIGPLALGPGDCSRLPIHPIDAQRCASQPGGADRRPTTDDGVPWREGVGPPGSGWSEGGRVLRRCWREWTQAESLLWQRQQRKGACSRLSTCVRQRLATGWSAMMVDKPTMLAESQCSSKEASLHPCFLG